MNALEIVRSMINTEGFAVDRADLERRVVEDLELGTDIAMQYGAVVFTVGSDPRAPLVHLYSIGAGARLLHACRLFMADVWQRTGHAVLVAPALNPKIWRLLERFGWETRGTLPTGHRMYVTRRPQ